MKVNGKYLNNKLFTPIKICSMAVIALAAAVIWQQALVYRKDRAIADLLSENANLKKSLHSIDGQLLELKETASDVRIFQKELVKVIKDIDDHHPITFASSKAKAPVLDADCGHDEDFDSDTLINTAHENIFKLESSQQNLRSETANLLGRAVTIRDILAKTPSMIPVYGHITSDFGIRTDPITKKQKKHLGVDIAAPVGTPVYASADGEVIHAGKHYDFGNLIKIIHEDGIITSYGHLSQISESVKKGAKVKRGDEIGNVGNKGARCRGAHVHYGVTKNGVYVDPKQFMFSSPPVVF